MFEKKFGERVENQEYEDYIGAYTIIIQEEKVLLMKTPKGYFLPGGGKKHYETLERCAVRELMEETGYIISLDELLGITEVFTLHREKGYFHPISYIYKATLQAQIRSPKEPDHQMEWIPQSEIEEKVGLEHQKWAIQQTLNQLST